MKAFNLSQTRRKITLWFLYLSVGAILVVLVQSCTQLAAETKNQDEPEVAIPVKTATIRSVEMAIPIRISGTVSPVQESRLSFKTGGIIKSIRVNEGDRVKAGSVLATLNLAEIQAQVLQARVGVEKSQRDFNRASALYRDTVGTLERLQNAATALEMSKANLVMSEHNLKYSTITAPTDGIILQKFVEENELATPGTPVLYFAASNKQWILKVGLTDKDVVRVQPGDPANISLDAWPNEALKGAVSQIGDAPNAMTGLYTVEITVNTKHLTVKPGFFARAEITPSLKKSYTLVPMSALQEGLGDQAGIFTVNANQRLHKETIRVDEIFNDELALSNRPELNGKEVVIEHGKELRNNQTVNVLN